MFVLFSLLLLCPLLFFSLFHVLLLPFLLYSSPPPPLLFHSSSSYLFSFSSYFLPLLFLDLLFYHHHYQQYQFSDYTTPSTESAGGLQFCSATYRLMKVKWDKETSAEDPLMEVKYKGQNWQLLLYLQASKVTVGHNRYLYLLPAVIFADFRIQHNAKSRSLIRISCSFCKPRGHYKFNSMKIIQALKLLWYCTSQASNLCFFSEFT